MSLEIEKNIPVDGPITGGKRHPWFKMEEGDSVFFENLTNAMSFFNYISVTEKKNPSGFWPLRRKEGIGYRIWKVKIENSGKRK